LSCLVFVKGYLFLSESNLNKGFANLDQQKIWRSNFAKVHIFIWTKIYFIFII